ncbi:MAG: hypothetical protein QOJ59_907 [Thermomicrobiales bacterium]|jgi:hypothetical protein|nr:hypothetical protein [Thermomicrobiales bacterium]
MPTSAYEQIRTELLPGERLLWSGRPRGGIRVQGQDGCLVPFMLLWMSIPTLAIVNMFAEDDLSPVAIVLLPFLFIGFYVLIGDRLLDARYRSKTAYGLTDRRVIVVDGLLHRQTQSLPLDALSDITLHERADRSGTITCTSPSGFLYKKNKRGETVARPLFRIVVDVRHVHDLLLEARANASPPVV